MTTTQFEPPRGTTAPQLGEYGALVEGRWLKTGDTLEGRSPYDHSLVSVVHRAGPQEIEQAIAAAGRAFETTRQMPSWQRAEILEHISARIIERREDFARTVALEAGKPIRTARTEIERAAFTFKVAAEEAKRIYGEIVPLDWLPGTENRLAHVRRVPLGPVAGISPFNFPLNLVAHKVAPAIAAGCPIIIRPASQTPVTALKLGEIILETAWPSDGFAVVPSSTPNAAPLVKDERLKKLTFTGSPQVGWALKAQAGRKRVTLELGGNAGNIVHADADIGYAVERLLLGAFSYAGQSCISVQRLYLHTEVYEQFTAAFVSKVKALKVGDPLDEQTDVGPMVSKGEADRIESWIKEAIDAGAVLLSGGERDGNLWQPTVLANITEEMRVSCQEAFAPIVGLYRYTDVMKAIEAVGASDFGLQAGLFTNDLRLINAAFDKIEVGGLMINDASAFRIDHMPYGGVKASGFGREGLRYAIEEMTEMKLLTFNPRG